MRDAFDLWSEWATKPHESMLSVDGDIHYPIMIAGRSARPREGQRSRAAISRKPEMQYVNRSPARRTANSLW
jgi:hypothetical protein